jgi:hypothetical protein
VEFLEISYEVVDTLCVEELDEVEKRGRSQSDEGL